MMPPLATTATTTFFRSAAQQLLFFVNMTASQYFYHNFVAPPVDATSSRHNDQPSNGTARSPKDKLDLSGEVTQVSTTAERRCGSAGCEVSTPSPSSTSNPSTTTTTATQTAASTNDPIGVGADCTTAVKKSTSSMFRTTTLRVGLVFVAVVLLCAVFKAPRRMEQHSNLETKKKKGMISLAKRRRPAANDTDYDECEEEEDHQCDDVAASHSKWRSTSTQRCCCRCCSYFGEEDGTSPAIHATAATFLADILHVIVVVLDDLHWAIYTHPAASYCRRQLLATTNTFAAHATTVFSSDATDVALEDSFATASAEENEKDIENGDISNHHEEEEPPTTEEALTQPLEEHRTVGSTNNNHSVPPCVQTPFNETTTAATTIDETIAAAAGGSQLGNGDITSHNARKPHCHPSSSSPPPLGDEPVLPTLENKKSKCEHRRPCVDRSCEGGDLSLLRTSLDNHCDVNDSHQSPSSTCLPAALSLGPVFSPPSSTISSLPRFIISVPQPKVVLVVMHGVRDLATYQEAINREYLTGLYRLCSMMEQCSAVKKEANDDGNATVDDLGDALWRIKNKDKNPRNGSRTPNGISSKAAIELDQTSSVAIKHILRQLLSSNGSPQQSMATAVDEPTRTNQFHCRFSSVEFVDDSNDSPTNVVKNNKLVVQQPPPTTTTTTTTTTAACAEDAMHGCNRTTLSLSPSQSKTWKRVVDQQPDLVFVVAAHPSGGRYSVDRMDEKVPHLIFPTAGTNDEPLPAAQLPPVLFVEGGYNKNSGPPPPPSSRVAAQLGYNGGSYLFVRNNVLTCTKNDGDGQTAPHHRQFSPVHMAFFSQCVM